MAPSREDSQPDDSAESDGDAQPAEDGETAEPAAAEGADEVDDAEDADEVERLRKENERLKKKVTEHRHGRMRSISSWVLIVLGCILAMTSIFVVFARNQVLNTDTYVNTVAPLASDPAIQSAVASKVSAALVEKTDLKQQVAGALPPRASFLVTPITSGLQTASNEIILKFMQSQQFQKLWVTMNRNAHQQLVNLLTGSTTGAVSSSNGQVSLDLSVVLAQVKADLDNRGITVFDKVPTSSAPTFVLFQSTQLARTQRLVKFLNRLAVVLPLITLASLAGGVLLQRNRRRGLVRAAAAVAVTMVVLLVAMDIGRNIYLNSLGGRAPVDALTAAFDAVVAYLLRSIRVVLALAVLLAAGAFLAGNAWFRGWLRHRQLPSWLTTGGTHDWIVGHRKPIRWGLASLAALVLIVWDNPTPLVVVIVALVAAGLIALVGLFRKGPRQVVPAGGGGGA